MRVLSISTVFPRRDEPRLGLFVRSRLEALARQAEVRVVAPVPWMDVSRAGVRIPRAAEAAATEDGELTVVRPRWFYPPGLGDWNGTWLAWGLAGTLDAVRRSYRFDVIDAHFGHPEGVAAARLARRYGCPYTVTLRGNETLHAAGGRKRRSIAAALTGASAVIGVSRRLVEFAVELGVDAARAHIIPNGIDGGVYHAQDQAGARRALGMESGRRHIVSAGYLIERKGHHRIIEALPALEAAGLECELWIVGEPGKEGDFEQQIRATAARLSQTARVHMVGAIGPTELARYMAAADVFCLASSREGWPNVVNEALACGAPVVACDVGGVPEMLPEGRYGIVVPKDEPQALAASLKAALGRSWDRAAIAAWGGGRSWDAVAGEVARALEASLRANAGRAL